MFYRQCLKLSRAKLWHLQVENQEEEGFGLVAVFELYWRGERHWRYIQYLIKT